MNNGVLSKACAAFASSSIFCTCGALFGVLGQQLPRVAGGTGCLVLSSDHKAPATLLELSHFFGHAPVPADLARWIAG